MAVFRKRNRWYIDSYDSYIKKRIRRVVKIPGIPPENITRQDALKAESIVKAQIAQGNFDIPLAREQLNFGELVDRYLEWANSNHRAPELDRCKVKFLLQFFKGSKINNINLWQVEKYKKARKALGRQAETINKELGILRRMYNLAVEWKLINHSPIAGMKLLKVPKKPYKVLKAWEFEKLFSAASSNLKPILLTAYFTGMRRGEIRKLKWDHIDFDEGHITVLETKNNEYRFIPMNSKLKNILIFLKDSSNSEFVFTHEGKPYSSNSAWNKSWNKALELSGIEYCTFHCLRHSFITNLIVDQKEDYATVMSLSGHKDIKMLQRYTHTHQNSKRLAVEKLKNMVNIESIDTYIDTMDHLDNVSDTDKKVVTN